jgi:secondary thiamine-phosphate synthase enzyme
VVGAVAEAGVALGFAVIYSQHTTAAIKINESEPLLIQDMERFLDGIASRDGHYLHNDFTIRTVNMNDDECPNGHAHCQHLVLSTSETLPIIGGRPQLGEYQRVFLVELDRPRPRQVTVMVLGV